MEKNAILKRESILPAVLAILTVVLYLPVMLPLAKQLIADPNYRHGLLIPVISGYVLWSRRSELAEAEGGGATLGFVIVAIAALLLIVGTAASEFFTVRFSLPLMLIGYALVLRGAGFLRKALFPLLFLFMMIPLPYIIYYKISFPMQIMSAKLSAGVLELIRVPVIRRGNILILPNYELEVVAACSGLRSLMTMFTLALVFAAFSGLGATRRVILVFCAVPAAIFANTLRLVVTAAGAYSISPAFAEGTLHQIAGFIVFFTGFLLLAICLGLLRWLR
jgi:exosortase